MSTYENSSSYWVLITDFGPGYWIFVFYIYACSTISILLLAKVAIVSDGIQRQHSLVMIFGAVVSMLAGLLFVSGVYPNDYPPLTYVGFTVTAIEFTWPIFRRDLFTLVPIAHHAVVSYMDQGIIAFNSDGIVTTTNPAAAELLGRTTESMVSVHVNEVISDIGEDFDLDTAEESPQTVTIDTRTVDVSITPIVTQQETVGRVILLKDVTERHHRERRLRLQNERLDRFTGMVSHDLRNPLNVALARVTLTRESDDRSHLEHAEQALERMERMIDELLTLARGGEMVAESERELLDVQSIAEQAWEYVDSAEARLTVDGSCQVWADSQRLLHVFENCFRNAIEHNESPVQLQVTNLPGEDANGFVIEDDGRGIPPPDRELVFEHGYTKDERGTGFGLSIVEAMIDAHGWLITLTEGTDGGARFEIETGRTDQEVHDESFLSDRADDSLVDEP